MIQKSENNKGQSNAQHNPRKQDKTSELSRNWSNENEISNKIRKGNKIGSSYQQLYDVTRNRTSQITQ